MCIAIYSPIGAGLPCEEYLKNSFAHNPDGAGFAFNLPNHTVQISKGYFSFDKFYNALKKADKKYNLKDCGVLLHCRITTHGGTNKECCHPFPLVADENIMKKTNCVTDYAVIHNGIISLTSAEAYRRVKMSDTMVFIEKYLSKIATNKKWFKNKSNFELIDDLIDSKMAILNGYGEIHSTSGFTKEEDGNWYSNTSYKEPRYSRTRWVSAYDWDDYDDWGQYYKSSNEVKKLEAPKEEETVEDDYTPLMKLERGQFVATNYHGNCDFYEYDPTFPMFTDVQGNIFMSVPSDINYFNKVVESVDYFGVGEFYDEEYNVIPFDPDYKAKTEILYS